MISETQPPCFSVYQANGFQYWPAWMFYGLHQAQTRNLPVGFVPVVLNSSAQETTGSEGQSPPSSPKLGFTQFKPKEKSQTTNCHEISKNSRDDDLSSNNGESQFICKRKKAIGKKKAKRGPQNKNRNITPSLVQQIFSFLCKPTKSKETCQKIFASLPKPEGFEVSTQMYYYFIKQIKEKLNHYVNEKSLSVLCKVQEIGIGLFSKTEQQFYLKMARMMAKYFVDNVLPYLILHSKRMFEDKRVEHLKIRRTLIQTLENLGC